jgi:hypothetical protein
MLTPTVAHPLVLLLPLLLPSLELLLMLMLWSVLCCTT